MKKGQKRQTTGAENPLGNTGVAEMMCEPVISRHAQSLKLWHLAWLSMIDIHLQIPVIHQCHISFGRETTNSSSEQSVLQLLLSFLRILTGLISAKLLLWPLLLLPYESSIIPTNVSLINEMLFKVQQLRKQMDAKVLLMIMKYTTFSSHHWKVQFFCCPFVSRSTGYVDD